MKEEILKEEIKNVMTPKEAEFIIELIEELHKYTKGIWDMKYGSWDDEIQKAKEILRRKNEM